jgi:hypothetical protein
MVGNVLIGQTTGEATLSLELVMHQHHLLVCLMRVQWCVGWLSGFASKLLNKYSISPWSLLLLLKAAQFHLFANCFIMPARLTVCNFGSISCHWYLWMVGNASIGQTTGEASLSSGSVMYQRSFRLPAV